MTPAVEAAIARGRITADLIALERARIFGAATALAEVVGVSATLTIIEGVKARLVAERQGQEGWVA